MIRLRFLFLLICLISLVSIRSDAQNFTFETWSSANTAVMTVNSFQTVTIDKRGKVWAGSTLGGLYCYRNAQWAKINTWPDITFRHAVPSNMPGDSNLWISSIGKTGVQAINGGMYYIDSKAETVLQYGITTSGLGSLFANSLVMNKSGKTFAALAQMTVAGVVRQGGVYQTNTSNPPPPSTAAFSKAIHDQGDVNYYSAGNRGEELWFARGANCSTGTCQPPYIARLNSEGQTLGQITNTNSPLPFTATSASAFARAIFTSANGNTFVGLNSGGIGVMKPNGTWKMLTSENSPFPAGAAVNFNAINDVYGEVWVGTSAGIFVYNGYGSIDDPESFKLLTTVNGLPNNFVNDIAIDTVNQFLWLATGTGISKTSYSPPAIIGWLKDAYINDLPVEKDVSPSLSSFLKKEPILNNVKIRLLGEDGALHELLETTDNGRFELKEAEPGKKYTIEIEYEVFGNKITYQYLNVKNTTYLGEINMPGLLIKDIQDFKGNMAKRCFDIKIVFDIKTMPLCMDAFDVSAYDMAYQKLVWPNTVKEKQDEKIEDLATFYAAMAAIYDIGKSAADLNESAGSDLMDVVSSLMDKASVIRKINAKALEYPNLRKMAYFKENSPPMTWFLAEVKREFDMTASELRVMQAKISNPDVAERMGTALTILEDAFSLLYKLAETGNYKETGKEWLESSIKKAIVSAWVAVYYTKIYAGWIHEGSVAKAANASNNGSIANGYSAAAGRLSSIKSEAQTIKTSTIEGVETARSASKYADYLSTITQTASIISAFVPLLQPAAPVLFSASKAAKTVSIGAQFAAFGIGVYGAYNITEKSKEVLPAVGASPKAGMQTLGQNIPLSQVSTQTLEAGRNTYKQKLIELKGRYNASPYDTTAYFNTFNEVIVADSLYSAELKKTLNYMWASADSASIYIPEFSNKLQMLIDSFITVSASYRSAFSYENIGYVMDNNPSALAPQLIQTADSIILLTDSSVAGIVRLANQVNTSNIPSPAYLELEDYILSHNHQPGSNGSFIYSFKNYGADAMNNVSFKLSPISAGYSVIGNDSVHFDAIAPNEIKQVSFNFHSSDTDSLGQYTIFITAANGTYRNIAGTLYVNDPTKSYTVKDGNWSSPETWSQGIVPTSATNAVIAHKITGDADGICNTLIVTGIGSFHLNSGKTITILH